MIHPPAWRGTGNTTPSEIKTAREMLKSMDMEYLSMTSKKDCGKFFKGYTTPFDMYVAHNSNTTGFKTQIRGINGVPFRSCIKDMKFVPNVQCRDLERILAKDGDERVNFLYERSYYGTDKKNMHDVDNEKIGEFKHPCVYMISRDESMRGTNGGELTLRYSNEIKKHRKTGESVFFGTPKVMFGISHESGIPHVDRTGKYGMTGFIGGIGGDIENFDLIAKAMDGSRFRYVMSIVRFNTEDWNRNVIRLLRKDFWKEFVDKDGNLIDEEGDVIDREGNRLDKDGNVISSEDE